MPTAVILDCYTVEPSGLGVPPYLSTYVRHAYRALVATYSAEEVHYLTIDDVRWWLDEIDEHREPSIATDARTYSATVNRDRAIELLATAEVVVVIAGDKVPSLHLHAINGTVLEIVRAMSCVRGKRVLLGPLASYVRPDVREFAGLFDAVHTHTVTAEALHRGSNAAATYAELRRHPDMMEPLLDQIPWTCIAEIEMYRGCTRRVFCEFCNEPGKHPLVDFRDEDDILAEVAALYQAGVRNFRLGQQTCFFSYKNRDVSAIESLLAAIRSACPDLDVLHIDNADPLAVASRSGGRIAELVATYCTDGNCAPMGMESFDLEVIRRNRLTCTPDILMRAIENVNAAGAETGPHGLPKLLPGLNLIYGLPGETHATHFENLKGLADILDRGLLCHRTNVRQVRVYPGTPLDRTPPHSAPSTDHFDTWKQDLAVLYEIPMKRRVYPIGSRVTDLHSFFVTSRGSWHRRLGSYSIQIVERDTQRPLFEPVEAMTITGHENRYVYGERLADLS